MSWKTLDDMDLSGKRVLVRVDINVPVEDGRVTDATRIERIVPTVRGHPGQGRQADADGAFRPPQGQGRAGMSLRAVLPALRGGAGPLGAPDRDAGRRPRTCTAEAAGRRGAAAGEHPLLPRRGGERSRICRRLAALGDVYCNDAFSAAHRAHASTEGIAHLLPACAGRLMQAELKALEAALGAPRPPGGGGGRRGQGLDQAGPAEQPCGKGRQPGDRRRHGQHLPRRAGLERGQIALRA